MWRCGLSTVRGCRAGVMPMLGWTGLGRLIKLGGLGWATSHSLDWLRWVCFTGDLHEQTPGPDEQPWCSGVLCVVGSHST